MCGMLEGTQIWVVVVLMEAGAGQGSLKEEVVALPCLPEHSRMQAAREFLVWMK